MRTYAFKRPCGHLVRSTSKQKALASGCLDCRLALHGLCACHHVQDFHDGMSVRKGHGACLVDNCPCSRFTWVGWYKSE